MTNRSVPDSPHREKQFDKDLTPAVLRRIEGAGRARRLSPIGDKTNAQAETSFSVASLTTLALVALGLAAVEAARIGLVHEALNGFFAGAGGALPFAAVLTLGLSALDGGLLLRMFAPTYQADTQAGGMGTWAAVGAWLLVTTANSILAMYAIAGAIDPAHQLADVAPAAVAIVILLLRVLLIGALAGDQGAQRAAS